MTSADTSSSETELDCTDHAYSNIESLIRTGMFYRFSIQRLHNIVMWVYNKASDNYVRYTLKVLVIDLKISDNIV